MVERDKNEISNDHGRESLPYNSQEKETKQKYLVENIIEADRVAFADYISCIREGGENLDVWTLDELQKLVKEFNDSRKQDNNNKDEINKISLNNNNKDYPGGFDPNFNIFSIPTKKCHSNILGSYDNLKIILQNPELVETGMFSSNYILYDVLTEPAKFKVKRRFSDFEKLREILIKLFPGVYIPPIPSKTIGKARFEEDFINQRMFYLTLFLQNIIDNELLKISEVVYNFVNQNNRQIYEQKVNDYLSMKPVTFIEDISSLTGSVFLDFNFIDEIYKNPENNNYIVNSTCSKDDTKSVKTNLSKVDNISGGNNQSVIGGGQNQTNQTNSSSYLKSFFGAPGNMNQQTPNEIDRKTSDPSNFFSSRTEVNNLGLNDSSKSKSETNSKMMSDKVNYMTQSITLYNKIMSEIDGNLKEYDLSIKNAYLNLDAVERKFEQLSILTMKMGVTEVNTLLFNESKKFYNKYKKIIYSQNLVIRKHFKEYLKYNKLQFETFFKENLLQFCDLKKKFSNDLIKLSNKKEKLWTQGDYTKMELQDNLDWEMKVNVMKDKDLANDLMCFKETQNLNILRVKLGYHNFQVANEFKRLINYNALKLKECLIEFSEYFYPSLTEGITAWTNFSIGIKHTLEESINQEKQSQERENQQKNDKKDNIKSANI